MAERERGRREEKEDKKQSEQDEGMEEGKMLVENSKTCWWKRSRKG